MKLKNFVKRSNTPTILTSKTISNVPVDTKKNETKRPNKLGWNLKLNKNWNKKLK